MAEAVEWRAVDFETSAFCSKGGCLEVGRGPGGLIALRNTQRRDHQPLVFDAEEWVAFAAGVKAGQFDFAPQVHR